MERWIPTCKGDGMLESDCGSGGFSTVARVRSHHCWRGGQMWRGGPGTETQGLALLSAEEGRADAALHPGGEHHHPLVRALGPGGGHGVHCARAGHIHPGSESGQRARALQDAPRG